MLFLTILLQSTTKSNTMTLSIINTTTTRKNGQPTGYSFDYSSNQNLSVYTGIVHESGRYNSNTIIPSGYGSVDDF